MEASKHPTFDRLMDAAYDKLTSNNAMAMEYGCPEEGWQRDFWQHLEDPQEKFAVIVGNFNYQVENGGLLQWSVAGNGYGTKETLNELIAAVSRMFSSPTTRTVKEILLAFKELRLSRNSSSERADRIMSPLDTLYYKVNDRFLLECEAHLVDKQS